MTGLFLFLFTFSIQIGMVITNRNLMEPCSCQTVVTALETAEQTSSFPWGPVIVGSIFGLAFLIAFLCDEVNAHGFRLNLFGWKIINIKKYDWEKYYDSLPRMTDPVHRAIITRGGGNPDNCRMLGSHSVLGMK